MGEGRCRRQPGEDGVREREPSLPAARVVPLAGKGGAVSAGAIIFLIYTDTCV